MASLVALPAVAAGTLLALSVPMLALKEILEKRTKTNMKKHLGRRRVCKVHFGELDAPLQQGDAKKKLAESKTGCGSSETASNQAPPPAYNDLFRPPPPYGRK